MGEFIYMSATELARLIRSEPELIHFAELVSDFTEGFVRPVVGKGEE